MDSWNIAYKDCDRCNRNTRLRHLYLGRCKDFHTPCKSVYENQHLAKADFVYDKCIVNRVSYSIINSSNFMALYKKGWVTKFSFTFEKSNFPVIKYIIISIVSNFLYPLALAFAF